MNIKLKEILRKVRIFFLKKTKFKTWTFEGDFYCAYNGINDVKKAVIGDKVYIGNKFHLAVDYLVIGENTLLASNVSIVGGDHKYDEEGVAIRDTKVNFRPGVKIGKDCWIGHGVTILSGVNIGDGAVIGAGSVVTKNISPFFIYAGNPARKIKLRFPNDKHENHFNLINKKK